LKSEINRIGTDKRITEETEVRIAVAHWATTDYPHLQQKERILNAIDEFVRDRIELADEVICSTAVEKIKPGDTIVTFAR
jgi:translation initiation factor 2B subunit (eIF-2B alpha/beta/delta family)